MNIIAIIIGILIGYWCAIMLTYNLRVSIIAHKISLLRNKIYYQKIINLDSCEICGDEYKHIPMEIQKWQN